MLPPLSLSDAPSFEQKQEEYFAAMLGRKWDCGTPGHTVCVPTQDGRHKQLSEQDFTEWVIALCTGDATTRQPPEWIMNSSYRPGFPSSGGNFFVARPVAVPPSRTQSRGPSWIFSFKHRGEEYKSSCCSSGVPGVGYYSGKALKWIGEKGVWVVEEAYILRCAYAHRQRLRRWQRIELEEGGTTSEQWVEKQELLFPLLGDALEMSRTCYFFRVNKSAYLIGREVQRWLKLHPNGPFAPRTAAWLALVQICLLPLLLSRISRRDPRAGDLSWDILEVLRRMPLHLHDATSISAAICIVVKEITYSPYTFQHSWLGVDIRSILSTILQARPLTAGELGAIHDMADRRLNQSDSQESDSCRPWEVAIFADCAVQDPSLKDVVLGPRGVESILSALHAMVDEHPPDHDLQWEQLSLVIRAFAFISEHAWVSRVEDPDVVTLLLRVFRRQIPERWFCIRFWAMDTIRNIVSHQPSTLDTLVIEHARDAFTSMLSASRQRVSTTSTPLLLDYRKEADSCAKELLQRIERWDSDPNRGSMDTIKVDTRNNPSKLSLSGPSYEEEGSAPLADLTLDVPGLDWMSDSMPEKLKKDSMNTVVAEDHDITPKFPTFDPLTATGVSMANQTPETYWFIDVSEFPWAVGSGLPPEETRLQQDPPPP